MSNDKKNQRQFLEIYEKYADELFRYCFFKTANRDTALEIVQEVFMKAWAALQEGASFDNAKAFLYASVRNSTIDWYRKKKPISLDELQEAGFDVTFNPSKRNTDRLEAQMIIEKAQELEEPYREMIVLRFVNDLSVAEIATLLGEKENNVSVRLHRALEKLKKLYIPTLK